jgi:hypothetical protein
MQGLRLWRPGGFGAGTAVRAIPRADSGRQEAGPARAGSGRAAGHPRTAA